MILKEICDMNGRPLHATETGISSGSWGQVGSKASLFSFDIGVPLSPGTKSRVCRISSCLESACSPREHDISTREPLLHIKKLNLIGLE